MAGSVAMTGVAMIGVVMMFLTIFNSHFRNIAICSLLALESKRTKRLLLWCFQHLLTLILEILLFVVCWNLKSKGQNGCYYGGRVGLMVLISVDVISKESIMIKGRVGLMVLTLVVISKKNIIIDCCVVVLIRCILIFETSASGPPRGLSWETLNSETFSFRILKAKALCLVFMYHYPISFPQIAPNKITLFFTVM
ncbi:hypothetical protein BD770DRAFT_415615 [Pilaira anomala]|nr:hypothetical protein BD770DRAFT_415615 [Pilaira anomala]